MRTDRSLASCQHLTVLYYKKGAERKIMSDTKKNWWARKSPQSKKTWKRRSLYAIAIAVVIAAVAGLSISLWKTSDELAKVTNPDGSAMNLSVEKGKRIDDGISLRSGNAPSVVGGDQQRCGLMFNYVTLVNCKGNNPTFIGSVNRLAGNLKMDWNNVLDWANRCSTVDARAILISNRSETDQQARDLLRPVWGNDVDKMPILPRQNGIINTKNQDVMDPFKDPTEQIRVTLVPLDQNCQRIVTSTSGIMADCLNGWWVEVPTPVAAPPAPPQSTNQPPPPSSTTVVPPPPSECPGGCVVVPPTCENGGIPPEQCVPVIPPTCENGGIPPEQCLVPKPPNPAEYPHKPEAPPAVVSTPAAPPVVPQAPATRTPQAPVHGSTGPNGATAPGANPAPAPGVNPSAPPISQAPRGVENGGPGAAPHSSDPDS